MKCVFKELNRYLATFLAGLLVFTPTASLGADDDVVLILGETVSGDTMVSFQSPGAGSGVLTQNTACALGQQFLLSNLSIGATALEGAVRQMVGDDAVDEFAAGFYANGIPLGDCGDDAFSGDFLLIYSSCAMIMGNGTQWMRWTVPPLSPEASMVALDAANNQAVEVPLETRLEQLNLSVGTGTLAGYQVSDANGTKPVLLNAPNPREFSATRYDYSFNGEIDPFAGQSAAANLPPNMLSMIPKVALQAIGHAWVVPNAPGADVVATFYGNFRDNVVPAAGMGSMMTGMVQYMSDIATRGMPVETTHSVSVGAGTLPNNFGMSGESTSTIKAILVLPGEAPLECPRTVVPEGVSVTNIGDMMQGLGG